MNAFKDIIDFIKLQFPSQEFIPLHEPRFVGNEKKYINETIDSSYVSSVGMYVNLFEEKIKKYTGSKYAVATVNGTSALHMALLVCGVKSKDEVLTQALTFIATANAISYIGADPIFIDVDRDTMGMSPSSLSLFLEFNAIMKEDGFTYNRKTGKKIAACVPMHTFGFPLRIDEIQQICLKWNINLVEDSAESLGSFYKNKHTGNYGNIGVFSFNGNKTITCGGGGAIITNDENLAMHAKHLTTQAKIPHAWRFRHDEIGYNYRMPNLNAALACAQLEQLDSFLKSKRNLAELYSNFFRSKGISFAAGISGAKANNWLNTVIFENKDEQLAFLEYSNMNGVMTRPIWDLMSSLTMFEKCQNDGLNSSKFWLIELLIFQVV